MRSILASIVLFVWTSSAVIFIGWAIPNCQFNGAEITRCTNIPGGVCCKFPRGGIQVRSVITQQLQECDISYFQQSTADSFCGGLNRATAAGPNPSACMTGGSGNFDNGGGGAYWTGLIVVLCMRPVMAAERPPPTQRVVSSENEGPGCWGYMIPEIYGWEGEGVWVLDFNDHPPELWEEYNRLPPTFDYDEHLRNMRIMGATWYASPMDHAGAASIVAQREQGWGLGHNSTVAVANQIEGAVTEGPDISGSTDDDATADSNAAAGGDQAEGSAGAGDSQHDGFADTAAGTE